MEVYLGAKWWAVSATVRLLYPKEGPGTHCIGVWIGPWASLERCGTSSPKPEFDPRTVQPATGRYTD
jgi:hypothetical protein